MKKILFLTLMFSLLASAALAQSKANFSGSWELDTINSKMDERMRVESMTMKVDQTEKEITVGTFMKRTMPAEGSGMNRDVVPTALTYSLVESTTLRSTSDKNSETSLRKASLGADGRLNLSSVRKINTQMGEITITIKETWELADGGSTLKISRTTESPRGTQNSELVFTKKEAVVSADRPAVTTDRATVSSGDESASTLSAKPKTISGGVLNGKATLLAKPEYPQSARAVNAGGAVNIQVLIDEQGNVVSATAVSGHPLLRQAAEAAAHKSKFTPTLLEGVPVKVTGIVVYNFVP